MGNSKQNFNKLKSIFENEADSQKLNVRGQNSRLASPSNRIKADKFKTLKPSQSKCQSKCNVIGGGLDLKGKPANEKKA